MSDRYAIEVTDELAARVLPCPFCGAQKVWMFGEHNIGMVYVACHGAGCYAYNCGPDIDGAIENWNRRAPAIDGTVASMWSQPAQEPATTLTVTHSALGKLGLLWVDADGKLHVGDKVVSA